MRAADVLPRTTRGTARAGERSAPAAEPAAGAPDALRRLEGLAGDRATGRLLRRTAGDRATTLLLQRTAGNRATTRLVRPTPAARVRLDRLGQRLDVPLDPAAEAPAFGEDSGDQRRWSRPQYEAMWEAEQGRKLTPVDDNNIKLGCIGITVNNLGVLGSPPLEESYSTFKQAHDVAAARNTSEGQFAPNPWVIFGVHFWSNQDPDPVKRAATDPSAFLPDVSGRVDMSGFKFRERPGFTNFDFAFWDDASSSHWHANHCDPTIKGQPCIVADPMKVFQSTREIFSATSTDDTDGQTRYEYPDFDREIFAVARASHYDPSRATKPALTSPRFMGPDGVTPDPVFQRIFDRKLKLKKGARRWQVKIVQQALVDLTTYDLGSFGPNKDGVDGVLGSKTAEAIEKFKADHNLFAPTVGEVDRGVMAKLDDLFPAGL